MQLEWGRQWVVQSGAHRRAKLQSDRYHPNTDSVFCRPDALPCHSANSVKALNARIYMMIRVKWLNEWMGTGAGFARAYCMELTSCRHPGMHISWFFLSVSWKAFILMMLFGKWKLLGPGDCRRLWFSVLCIDFVRVTNCFFMIMIMYLWFWTVVVQEETEKQTTAQSQHWSQDVDIILVQRDKFWVAGTEC